LSLYGVFLLSDSIRGSQVLTASFLFCKANFFEITKNLSYVFGKGIAEKYMVAVEGFEPPTKGL